MLPQLHAALGNVSGHRRDNRIALRCDPCIAIRVLGLQDRRIALHRGAIDECMRGERLAFGLRQRGARQVHALLRVPHFFPGDGLIGNQRFAFCQVNLRTREFQFARFDFRVVLSCRGFLLANLPHGLEPKALAARLKAVCASVGSSFTSTCPALTSWVSSANTAMTVPETCAEITTRLPLT